MVFSHPQSCVASTLSNSRIFSSSQKPHIPLPHPQPLATTNPLSVSGFACSGCFIEMESYDMWPFVSGLFHRACHFQCSSTLQRASALFLFVTEHIQLDGHMQFFSSVQLVLGLFPPFCCCGYCCCEHGCTGFWGGVCFQFFWVYTTVELLGHKIILFNIGRNHQNVFYSGGTISHSHMWCPKAPVSPGLCQ